MRLRVKLALVAVVVGTVAYGMPVVAQPLVTGNLTLYYDFDEIVTNGDGQKQFIDESGNDFRATVHEGDPDIDVEPGTVTVETTSQR